jgi:ABC-type uncharacterized transport system auxiliary subunit
MSRHVMNRRVVLASALACAGLAACASDPVPRDTFYRLAPPAALSPLAGGPIKGVLEVPPLRAAGAVNERAMLYREGPSQLAQYSYHAWIEPPTQMVQRSLIAALRQAEVFESIVSPEMRMDRDYELIGDLRQWEHVPADNVVAIQIEVGLRRVRGNQQVLLKTYQASERVSGGGMGGVADAFTRGMDAIYKQIVGDLGAAPKP